ncbi:XRE family transcriptional regulator [Streptomyces noursei]
MTEPARRSGARRTTLAEKLDRLITALAPVDGAPPSYNEIARAIDEAAGERVISPSYIWKLHKGEATNPRVGHLEALATYFDVPVAYFLDDDVASHIDEQLRLLDALKTGAVRNLALRANELSPESLRALNDMLERLHTLEAPGEPRQSGQTRPA